MSLSRLTGTQLRKGTGDVLKDLEYAEHLTDTDEPGFGEVICSGLQLAFVNRAVRVAMNEIKVLRQRKEPSVVCAEKGGLHE